MEEPWSFTTAASKRSQQKRARFNLLALDHGEYYFQQGRLKLCSRGLLFEPADRLLPLVKYPFKDMETQMERVGVMSGGWGDAEDGGGRGGEGFRFRCIAVVESRRNDEVGPYVTKKAGGSGAAGEWSDWTFSFSLLHTPLGEFLGEARRLREVALRVKERGHGYEEPLLSPLLEERLRDSTRRFDTIHLVDFRETLLLPCPVRVDRITPLLRNPGCIMVTDARVYFQPAELNNVGEPVASFALAGVLRVFKRRHMLRQTGLELFMEYDGGSAFFNFESSKERDELFDVLMSQPLVARRAESARDIEKETKRWQAGQVSNYEYLVFLNTVAGRTVNDLTQYPVFPWVLRDFESTTLNLDDPSIYRDLSRPIGALDPERLEYFRDRLRNMPDAGLHPESGLPPPFLYGTHYSTPGYALFFLVRAAPEEMLCLQNGRFDDPDRSFTSVKGAWDSVLKNHADLKELIPEFYAGDGSFLSNKDDLPLGVTQSGQRVGDVELPPWSRNPRDFVRKMRRALESPYVSGRLHLWIDLIFGCRQRGRAAIEADNLFYHLTYEGAVDLEKIDDPRERAALESQISEFGQCPSLLFRGPHPRRDSPSSPVILQNPMHPAIGQRVAGAFAAGAGMTNGRRTSNNSIGLSGTNGGSFEGRGGNGGVGQCFRGSVGEPGVLSPELHMVNSTTSNHNSTFSSLAGAAQNSGSSNSTGHRSFSSGYFNGHQQSGTQGGLTQQQQQQQQQQQRQLPTFQPAFAPQANRTRSPSPTSLAQNSNASYSGATAAIGSTVGSSVGALWKRGLAMASAAVEVTGSRGGIRSLPRWSGGAGAGGGEEGVGESRGSGEDGLGNGRSPMSPAPPVTLNDDEAFRLEVERMERARGVPTNHQNVDHNISVDDRSQLRDGPGAYAQGSAAADKDAPLMHRSRTQGQHQAQRLSGGCGVGSTPPSVNLGGSSNLDVSGSNRMAQSPALDAARAKAWWGMDPRKVDLRPGQPMALHRDGITCAHLVMSANGKQQRDGDKANDSSLSPTPPSTRSRDESAPNSGGAAGLTLCTSSKDCSLKICSLDREAAGSGPVSKAYTRRRLAGGELPLSSCALTADGKHAVAGSWDNGVLLYSVQAAAVVSKVDGAHEDGVRCLALHEGLENAGDDRKTALATGSWDAAVKVWDIGPSGMNPNPILELFDLEAAVQSLAFDATGKLLAAGSEDGMVAVWDITTGILLATFSAYPDQAPVASLHWTQSRAYNGEPFRENDRARFGDARESSPDYVEKACLVVASEAGEISRFSPLGSPIGTLRLDCDVTAMESDGRCTVVACKDGSIRLLSSLDQGGFMQILVRESGHEGEITCLHVSSSMPNRTVSEGDGKRQETASTVVIVTGSEGGAVRVWDVVRRSRA